MFHAELRRFNRRVSQRGIFFTQSYADLTAEFRREIFLFHAELRRFNRRVSQRGIFISRRVSQRDIFVSRRVTQI